MGLPGNGKNEAIALHGGLSMALPRERLMEAAAGAIARGET